MLFGRQHQAAATRPPTPRQPAGIKVSSSSRNEANLSAPGSKAGCHTAPHDTVSTTLAVSFATAQATAAAAAATATDTYRVSADSPAWVSVESKQAVLF
jgi:hypothetical protein